MHSGHTDVVDTQVGVVASAQLELGLEGSRLDDVDDSAGVLFVTQTLQDQVVSSGLLVLD